MSGRETDQSFSSYANVPNGSRVTSPALTRSSRFGASAPIFVACLVPGSPPTFLKSLPCRDRWQFPASGPQRLTLEEGKRRAQANSKLPAIQPNISYVGVQGSYTFFEWGKRKNVVRERETLVILAQQKAAQTQDEIRQKTQKAFREVQQAREALHNAEAMLKLRKEAATKATGLKAMLDAGKDELTAEVELVKADLAYRTACGQLMGLIGGTTAHADRGPAPVTRP